MRCSRNASRRTFQAGQRCGPESLHRNCSRFVEREGYFKKTQAIFGRWGMEISGTLALVPEPEAAPAAAACELSGCPAAFSEDAGVSAAMQSSTASIL